MSDLTKRLRDKIQLLKQEKTLLTKVVERAEPFARHVSACGKHVSAGDNHEGWKSQELADIWLDNIPLQFFKKEVLAQGSRVRFYGLGWMPDKGKSGACSDPVTVVAIEKGDLPVVVTSPTGRIYFVHPKQCRVLTKKSKT